MKTLIKNAPGSLPALLAVGAIAAGVAGCGGGGGYSSGGSSSSSSASSSAQRPAPATSAGASAGIPQHNGGDHDPDNHGAPSDGDGNQ